MATELRVIGAATGSIIYAVISRDSDEQVWNVSGTAFEVRNTVNWADYVIALSETPAGSRIWYGDFPTQISATGNYHVDYYKQAAASPDWSKDDILGSETLYSDGSSITDEPIVGRGLISVADYKAQVTTSRTDQQLQTLITMATAAIESYCNRTLMSEASKSEYLDGNGLGYLQLKGVPETILSATEDPEATSPTTLDVNDLSYTADGVLYWRPDASQRTFTPGVRNYLVTYSTTAVLSADIKLATILVVQELERMTDSDALVSEKAVGDVKVKYGAPVYADLSQPVFSEAVGLLAPYRHFACI